MNVAFPWPSYKMPLRWADIACWEWKYPDPQETADLVCARCGKPVTASDAPAVRAWTVSGREYRVHADCWPHGQLRLKGLADIRRRARG